MTTKRAGFTLVELLVVAVVGALMLSAALQVLVTNQRTYTAQTAVISGQQATRMAIEVLFNELREASPGDGDVLAIGQDSIRVRLMRKFATVCGIAYGMNPVLRVVHPTPSSRKFHRGDSIVVYADNYENDDDDDVWIAAQITAIDSLTPLCPQDLSSASDLAFGGGQGSLFVADSVRVGAPIRSYTTYTFGVTDMLGDPYLGRRVNNGDMVPIAGPLRRVNGLEFTYRDSIGAVTSDRDEISQIEVMVRTGSEVLNSLGQMVSDSVSVWIHSRN